MTNGSWRVAPGGVDTRSRGGLDPPEKRPHPREIKDAAEPSANETFEADEGITVAARPVARPPAGAADAADRHTPVRLGRREVVTACLAEPAEEGPRARRLQARRVVDVAEQDGMLASLAVPTG